MDVGHTYGDPDTNERVTIYAPPEYRVPKRLELRIGDSPVELWLISDRDLTCYDETARRSCGSYECHRAELGSCQCGRHPEGVRIAWD